MLGLQQATDGIHHHLLVGTLQHEDADAMMTSLTHGRYHSIHSVIERSPRHLLHEIILVDDGSNGPRGSYITDGPLEK